MVISWLKVFIMFQVETVGDKYMAVSGIPEPCATHAKNIAKLALDMMDRSNSVHFDGEQVVSYYKLLAMDHTKTWLHNNCSMRLF